MSRRFLSVAGTSLLTLFAAGSTYALDRDVALRQLHHTAFGSADGLQGEALRIVQTADGFLWVKTSRGVFRYDGVRFELAKEQSGGTGTEVKCLFAPASGGLWTGGTNGDLRFFHDGRVDKYPVGDPPSKLAIQAIQQDADGVIWVATSSGPFRSGSAGFEKVGVEQGFPGASADAFFLSRDGSLWITAPDGKVFKRRPGQKGFVQAPDDRPNVINLSQSPLDGRMWATTTKGLLRLSDEDPSSGNLGTWLPTADNQRSSVSRFDRDGSLWISKADGIARISSPELMSASAENIKSTAATDSFGVPSGLTSEVIYDIFEDREGSVWLATSRGVDRFRGNRVIAASLPPARKTQYVFTATADGSIWAANWNSTLLKIRDVVEEIPDVRFVTSLGRGTEGSTLVGGQGGQVTEKGLSASSTSWVGDKDDASERVITILSDANGETWASTARPAVYHRAGNTWRRENERIGLPARRISAISKDLSGRLWFAYADQLLILKGDEKIRFGPESGLLPGYAGVLSFSGDEAWFGGSKGVGVFAKDRFHVLTGLQEEKFDGTYGVVVSREGDLWLQDGRGAVRVGSAELGRFRRDFNHRVKFERFNELDGITGFGGNVNSPPTVLEAPDGRIWFATTTGLHYVEPGKLRRMRNAVTPAVHFMTLVSDGEIFGPAPRIELKPEPANIVINYTATSLAIPERVQFRYKLEGFDDGWQEVGTRRQAYYTKLPPGDYKFHVTAANNDGLWNDTGTSIDIRVKPRFFQTTWFKLLCGVSVLLLAWAGYVLRLQYLKERIVANLKERSEERERIARELHDTVLQSVHGLIMKIQAIASRMPKGQEERERIERALAQADSVLLEGRDKVSNLRAKELGVESLQDALNQCGVEFASESTSSFRVVVTGQPKQLRLQVPGQVYLIGREAISNAFRHARAKNIEVDIVWGSDDFCLSVRDDGVGVGPAALADGREEGHWGMKGMRERADSIKGQLTIASRDGAGTEMVLTIPGHVAYVRARSQRFGLMAWLRRRTSGRVNPSA